MYVSLRGLPISHIKRGIRIVVVEYLARVDVGLDRLLLGDELSLFFLLFLVQLAQDLEGLELGILELLVLRLQCLLALWAKLTKF